jgi:dihydrofolate synthase/folylpolyglutamate synthase
MGLLAFAREGLDVCVLEAGLGGRLDATNVVTPAVAAITTLGLDHTAILGDTLAEIAGEKAGIIKPGVPVVVAPAPESIERLLRNRAGQAGAQISVARPFRLLDTPPLSPDDVREGPPPSLAERMRGVYSGDTFEADVALVGKHQAINASVAALVCEVLDGSGLPVPSNALIEGLGAVRWPARVELVGTRPWEVIDCAHNRESARALLQALQRHLCYERLVLVLGSSEDKPVEEMARELASADHVVLTEASLPRALPAAELVQRTEKTWPSAEVLIPPAEALRRARELAGPRDLLCITGSFYLVGELIEAGLVNTELCRD